MIRLLVSGKPSLCSYMNETQVMLHLPIDEPVFLHCVSEMKRNASFVGSSLFEFVQYESKQYGSPQSKAGSADDPGVNACLVFPSKDSSPLCAKVHKREIKDYKELSASIEQIIEKRFSEFGEFSEAKDLK